MRACHALLVSLPLLTGAWGCAGGAAPSPSPSPTAAAPASPAASADPNRPLPSPFPAVAARVNGEAIPIRNVAIMVQESIELGRVSESRRNALYRDALEQLIRRELLLQEAQARGVKADDLEVQRTYDQMRGHHKDEQAWRDFLKSRSLDEETLRAEIRVRHTVQALLAAEAAQHPENGSDEEARALYDSTDASAFQPPGSSPAPKPPFEEVKEFLRQEVVRRKLAQASQRFVESLVARAKVERFL
ncbi:MAG TPA: SurA N-terminal domain-containing protein [Vicinamibacteria bacterium]|nr:SurA N-terminal domain-containing protein [Vicinamibacteria bacterium]